MIMFWKMKQILLNLFPHKEVDTWLVSNIVKNTYEKYPNVSSPPRSSLSKSFFFFFVGIIFI